MENVKITEIDDKTLSVLIPIKIRKKKGYVTMILPEGAKEYEDIENPQNYNEKLTQAFAKAHKWKIMLKQKEVDSLSEIAAIEKVDKAYIAKIFKLNYVAPDIVEAILDGQQPQDLTLRDFTKKSIPDLWEEQRMIFGFI
jgi:hypothetical protein